jgi:hypothetical protein
LESKKHKKYMRQLTIYTDNVWLITVRGNHESEDGVII